MEVGRRQLLLWVPTCLVAAGCTRAWRPEVPGRTYHELHPLQGREGASTVLVCMPDTPQTAQVWLGLSDELATDFSLVAVRIQGRGDASEISEGIRRHRPRAVVLMNNPTVAAYRDLLMQSAGPRLPAVVVMTSFLEVGDLDSLGATGIAYEVPLITAVTGLRRIVATPVDRIGIAYREPLAGFVARQSALARREQISVVAQRMSRNPNGAEVKWALRRLKSRSDAVWLLNDDNLLTPHLIAKGWLPGLDERPWRPTIVGAASLVSAKQSFGTFAVLPDHTALGTQAADLVFGMADRGWVLPPQTTLQLPVSTTITIDGIQARQRFALRREALAQVDRIVE